MRAYITHLCDLASLSLLLSRRLKQWACSYAHNFSKELLITNRQTDVDVLTYLKTELGYFRRKSYF